MNLHSTLGLKKVKDRKSHPERIQTLNAAQLFHLAAAASSSVLLHPDLGGEKRTQEGGGGRGKGGRDTQLTFSFRSRVQNIGATSMLHSTDSWWRCNCSVELFRRSKFRGRPLPEKLLLNVGHTLIN